MLALLRGGASRGWEQIVLNPFDRRSEDSVLSEEVVATGASYTRQDAPTTRFAQLPSARSWLRSELTRLSPMIVHVHLFHALALAATLKLGGVRTVLTHHHGDHFRASGKGVFQRIDRRLGRRMDRVVAPSKAVATFLKEDYGYPPHVVTVIPNGWEGVPRGSRADDSEAPLICVGNLRAQKDHHILLRAFRVVVDHHPAMRLKLIGDGPLRTELERCTNEFGLTAAVEFCGAVNDVWGHLSQAQLFVLASRYEPLGIAALEAMAAGLPVVATDVGGLRETVRSGMNGILVPPGDPHALSETLLSLIASPGERQRMGITGREMAREWKMEVTVDRYFDLYEELSR